MNPVKSIPNDKNRAPERRALGKGLDSLLPRAPQPAVHSLASPSRDGLNAQEDSGKPLEISLDRIERNPFQTRTHFDEEALNELADSIRVSGVLQPILLRPIPDGRFQLIAGERRWKASKLAGLKSIPALVRSVPDEQVMEITIIENLQRADLNPIEQAMAFSRLSRQFGMNQEVIAQRTGKDRATIANYLRLLRLPTSVQEMVASGELSFGHAKVILSLQTESEMEDAAQRIRTGALSVRQTESMVKNIRPAHGKDHARKEERAAPPRDPNVADAEERLRSALGMRVSIEDKHGRGRVIIEYARLEDFDTLMERILS